MSDQNGNSPARWVALEDPREVVNRVNGGTVTLDQVEKRAVELRMMGQPLTVIADELGFFDVEILSATIREGTARMMAGEEAGDMRRLMLLRQDAMTRALMPMITHTGTLYDEDGEPVTVPLTVFIEAQLKVDAARAKLVGLNAPEEIRVAPPVEVETTARVDKVGQFLEIIDIIAERNPPEVPTDPDDVAYDPDEDFQPVVDAEVLDAD